jgi:hypothetical protein
MVILFMYFFFTGLYDSIPAKETLDILKKYLPSVLMTKLTKYVTAKTDDVRSHIDWNFFQHKLEKINLDACANQLVNLFEKRSLSEDQVKTFHISTNLTSAQYTEPTSKNTLAMIYQFLMSIYQRNVLASLIKYILLQDILNKLKTSPLTKTYKGVFSSMKKRLEEIVFECVLTAFNGSNYDNYLICNQLTIILTNLNERIHIFKKGASISTVKIIVKNCLNRFRKIEHTKKKKSKKDTASQWLMNLYIKDIRNLVAANMSLDKIGKLFNLKVSKLCFPYEKATSIKALKSFTSLNPKDDMFWRDTFSSKEIPLDIRLEAQQIFNTKGFSNLYQYSDYYLKQDCLLLHSIVLTLFDNYLADGLNIYVRRNYSQSNLAYQQFFIVEPSRQIDQVLAPKKISNTFLNYFVKQAVTGGLCTSFVHANIDNTTVINEHFNYLEKPHLNPENWPNFHNIDPWKKVFTNTPAGINTIDIRSLYPSATVKKMPVNSPLFYTRFTKDNIANLQDKTKYSTIDIKSFCENVRERGDFETDCFQLINEPPRFYNEFHALNQYLSTLENDIDVIRFQSSFTAMGQLYFAQYPVDGFLAYKKKENSEKTFIKIIQYQSVFRHGHISSCWKKNDENQQKLADNTVEVKMKITMLLEHLVEHFQLNHVEWEYVEISDCEYNHKIPQCKDKQFIFPYKKKYSYKWFLQNILDKKLTGLILVKDLEIKKDNQNPCFGFIIQKAQYELKHLSDYTQQKISRFSPCPKVISVHKSSSFMILSTDYFIWLNKTFGFEKPPDIYHALLFQQAHYLTPHIEMKLLKRKKLKEDIKNENDPEKKQIYEIKAELLKLMLNSCYGFTLCNLTSSKFKSFKNLQTAPDRSVRKNKLISCMKLSEGVFIAEYKAAQLQHPFETMLGHVGCSILFHSKIILLKRLNYLLKFLNPTKAQLLYMDTDSAHFLLKHEKFEDNVDENLRKQFIDLKGKHFEEFKLSGIWVEEGFFNSGQYIGEKSYVLSCENKTLSHMKGLNSMFQNKFVTENIDHVENPVISYNIMHKSPDFAIYKTYMSKNLFNNYIPLKRYFVYAAGSLPLKIN